MQRRKRSSWKETYLYHPSTDSSLHRKELSREWEVNCQIAKNQIKK